MTSMGLSILDCMLHEFEDSVQAYIEANLGRKLSTEYLARGYHVIPVTLPGKGRVDFHVTPLDTESIQVDPRMIRGTDNPEAMAAYRELWDYLLGEHGV